MNLADGLAKYLDDQGFADLHENLFVSYLPAKTLDDGDWVISQNGGPVKTGGNFLKWRQTTFLRVQHRVAEGEKLYEADATLRRAVAVCTELDGERVYDLMVTPLNDDTQDNRERFQGSWQIEITTQAI